jgi:hypothetical protein
MRFLPSIGLMCLLILSACGEAKEDVRYIQPPSAGGRLCAAQCHNSADFCEKDCDIGLRACMTEMQQRAMVDYEKYAQGQWLSHEPLELRPRDFERPDKCSRASCHRKCEEKHQTCYEACGGEVKKTSSCSFLCF